jgi:putative transposase
MLTISGTLIDLVTEVRWLRLTLRSSQSIQAENLFLRRQLALYIERGARPRRIDSATRIALILLSRLYEWRSALVVVRPQTSTPSACSIAPAEARIRNQCGR